MKKLSIIFIISLSFLLSSCFNKEEKTPIVETPKNINSAIPVNNTIQVETNTGNTVLKEIGKGETKKKTINSDKPKEIKEETKTSLSSSGEENKINTGTGEILNNSGSIESLSGEVIETHKINLIKATISDETENPSDEEKEFMKNEIDNVDTDTFVRFKNSIYSKDKNSVYFSIYGLNVLTGVSPINFKVLQPDGYYWTNGSGIYILDKEIDGIDFDSLKFAVISDKFIIGGDKNNLYIGSRGIFGSGNINSLAYLSDNCLKDNKNVYCSFGDYGDTKGGDSYDVLEGIDVNSFEVIDYSYAKDKDNIYFEGEIMNVADKKSFKVFKNSLFAKDNNIVYYEGLPLGGIQDITSFQAINGIPQDKNCFYKIDNVENMASCDTE